MFDRRIRLTAPERTALADRLLDLLEAIERDPAHRHLVPSVLTARTQVQDFGYLHPDDLAWLNPLAEEHLGGVLHERSRGGARCR